MRLPGTSVVPTISFAFPFFLSLSLFAQQPTSTGQTPTFHSQSELVQVPVLVTRKGKHVAGLKLEDFTVIEDGVPQKIARFEEVGPSTIQVDWATPAPGTFSNQRWTARAPGHLTILVFDLINTPYDKQRFLRDSLLKFLSAIPNRHDPFMVAALTFDGLVIVHDFTTDTSALRQAIRKIKPTLSGNEHPRELAQIHQEATQAAISAIEAQNGGHVDADDPEVQRMASLFQITSDAYLQTRDLDKTELTLLLLQRLASSLSGFPGRKSLIWATGGVSFLAGSDQPATAPIGQHKSEGLRANRFAQSNEAFEHTWEVLSDANIAVYPVDMMELINPGYSDASSQLSTVRSMQFSQEWGLRAQAMNAFVDKTGGAYCELRSNLESCFSSAIDDSSSYYMLAYYPNPGGRLGWRQIKVTTGLSSAKIHTRSGYYFRAPNTVSKVRQDAVAEAVISPLDFTAITLVVRWTDGPFEKAGLSIKKSFEIFVDPRSLGIDSAEQNHFRFSLTVASHVEKMKFVGKLAKTIDGHLEPADLESLGKKPLVFRDNVDLATGENEVRFVVRDELSGRIGSVTAKVEQ